MSTVEYTRCDGAGCGRVTPDGPRDDFRESGWATLAVNGSGLYDLCPDCARKALEAVGIREKEAE